MKAPQRVWWTIAFLFGYDLKKIPSYYSLEIDQAMLDNWAAMIAIPNQVMLRNIRAVWERGDPKWHLREGVRHPITIGFQEVKDAINERVMDNFLLTAVIPVLSTYYYHYNYIDEHSAIVDGWQPMEQQTLSAEPKKQMVFDWALKFKRK